MRPPLPTFPHHRSRPIPWRPLADAEWDELGKIIRPTARGRPPADARRTWNGIFWVACSRSPWRAMPAEFGRADTAHRTLRRAATARHLHRLLLMVARLPGLAGGPLEAIEWFIVRTFRRAFRIAPGAIAFAHRLGMVSALPADPAFLPDTEVAEKLGAFAREAAGCGATLPLQTLESLQDLAWRAAGMPWLWKTTG